MSSRPCGTARRRPRPNAAWAVLLLTALAAGLPACDTVSSSEAEERPSTVSQPTEEAPATPSAADPVPETAEVPEPETPGATQTTALPPEPPAPEPPAPEPVEPAIDDDPAQLIGLEPASLTALLGAPQLIRRETPAAVWQYQAEGCVLDVVLYPEDGADKVTYLEAREDGLTKIPPRQCLGKLLRAHQGLPAG